MVNKTVDVLNHFYEVILKPVYPIQRMRQLAILLVCFCPVLAGCAAPNAYRTAEEQAMALRRDPKKFEQMAKEALIKMAQAWAQGDATELAKSDPHHCIKPKGLGAPASLDLLKEAVWLGKDSVLIRASWSRDSLQSTGPLATRHMADFHFTVADPMTLQSIEGENPFETSVWEQK